MDANTLMIVPFAALLILIALGPLLFHRWWEKHYPKVAIGLGLVTLTLYIARFGGRDRALHTGLDYISFICLIGSLFIISGGILIRVKREATPIANVIFLLIGAIVSNLLGTTGASMLLIRPWLRMNKYRLTGFHVVFFIFIVSNVGGALTPIGDPPLFLGYLHGVPFWWMATHCWPIWLAAVGILLGMFYILDRANFRRAPKTVPGMETTSEQRQFDGLPNLFFLAIVVGAAMISHPPFLREGLMVAAALGSWFATKRQIHEANDFSFGPIKEVAILFAGIFATMLPALDWLESAASNISRPTPGFLFWSCGALSSVLDNAPTYLAFLSANHGAFLHHTAADSIAAWINAHGSNVVAGGPDLVPQAVAALQSYFPDAFAKHNVTAEQVQMAMALNDPYQVKSLKAISIAAVFFGACTYLGNGPNFLVKGIAAHQKVRAPGFIAYVLRFTLPYMFPMLLLVWWIWFRK